MARSYGNFGRDGRTIWTVSGAPSNTVGVDGDYAIDPTALMFYGPKTAATWPAGTSLLAAITWANLRAAVDDVTALGTVSSGTATFDTSLSRTFTLTNGGAHTWSFTGWPSSGYGEVEIICTNAGAFTLTLPTINWYKGDGTVSTTFSSMNVTLQSSGVNTFIIWTPDGGTTLYGRVV